MESPFFAQLTHFRGSLDVRAAQLDRIESALVESAFAADERMRLVDERAERLESALDNALAGLAKIANGGAA